jgi:hypothetical protein
VESRIAQDDFEHASRRRIAPEYGVELLADMSRHSLSGSVPGIHHYHNTV